MACEELFLKNTFVLTSMVYFQFFKKLIISFVSHVKFQNEYRNAAIMSNMGKLFCKKNTYRINRWGHSEAELQYGFGDSECPIYNYNQL